MRLTEFRRAVANEFGALADVLLRETVLPDCGYRTAGEALVEGYLPQEVWLGLCRVQQVPPERWYGVGLAEASGGHP